MYISDLVKLMERAWSLEVLAALHRGVPGRQAALVTATGAGRTAFADTAQHLLGLGMIERNPGHGHPLRPEFRLTPAGQTTAAVAASLLDTVSDPAGLGLLRKRWSLPVLAAVGSPRRFSQIRFDLNPVTDRALSQAMTQLQEHGWVDRLVDADIRPIRPLYRAAGAGMVMSRLVNAHGLRGDASL